MGDEVALKAHGGAFVSLKQLSDFVAALAAATAAPAPLSRRRGRRRSSGTTSPTPPRAGSRRRRWAPPRRPRSRRRWRRAAASRRWEAEGARGGLARQGASDEGVGVAHEVPSSPPLVTASEAGVGRSHEGAGGGVEDELAVDDAPLEGGGAVREEVYGDDEGFASEDDANDVARVALEEPGAFADHTCGCVCVCEDDEPSVLFRKDKKEGEVYSHEVLSERRQAEVMRLRRVRSTAREKPDFYVDVQTSRPSRKHGRDVDCDVECYGRGDANVARRQRPEAATHHEPLSATRKELAAFQRKVDDLAPFPFIMENNDNMLKKMPWMEEYEPFRRETSCCRYDGNSSDFEHNKNLWSNMSELPLYPKCTATMPCAERRESGGKHIRTMGGQTERGQQRPAAEERLSRNVLPRGLLDDVVAAMEEMYVENNERKNNEKGKLWILDLGSGYQSLRGAVEDAGFVYVPVDRVKRVGDCDVELCLDFSKSTMLLIIYSIVKHHDLELRDLHVNKKKDETRDYTVKYHRKLKKSRGSWARDYLDPRQGAEGDAARAADSAVQNVLGFFLCPPSGKSEWRPASEKRKAALIEPEPSAKPGKSEETLRAERTRDVCKERGFWDDGAAVGGGHGQPYLQLKYAQEILRGAKTWEGRAYAGWATSVLKDDYVTFKVGSGEERVIARILEVRWFRSFEAMLKNCGLGRCLPGVRTIAEGVAIYRKFRLSRDGRSYAEVEPEVGVVAFRLRPLS
ncbi:hypothetical protein SO694_00195019 [Aureococcus anophagefferens]|uniref:ASCH domain-containing protein n=1 Tax=Aureococcus anophagefferens TaxID=44056 RepID=A0ABR1FP18_AURAN